MTHIAFNRGGTVAIANPGGLIAKGTGPEQITTMQRDRFAEMIAGAMAARTNRSIQSEGAR